MSKNSEDYFKKEWSGTYNTSGYWSYWAYITCQLLLWTLTLLIEWKIRSIPFNSSGAKRISAASFSGDEAGNN